MVVPSVAVCGTGSLSTYSPLKFTIIIVFEKLHKSNIIEK